MMAGPLGMFGKTASKVIMHAVILDWEYLRIKGGSIEMGNWALTSIFLE